MFTRSQIIMALLWVFVLGEAECHAKGAKKGPPEMYSVQLNAYTDKHNAELFVLSMKAKGYHPYIVSLQKDKTWYKIMVGPYSSKEKALQVVEALSQKEKLKAFIIPSPEPNQEKIDREARPPVASAPIKPVPSKKVKKKRKHAPSNPAPIPAKAPEYDSTDVVVSLFLAWVKAWQGKDADSYLAFYSQNFSYPGKSLEDWRNSRRATLARSTDIKIDFTDIQIVQGKDSVAISFVQHYRSDRHSDKGHKTLTWKREGEVWRIYKEVWAAI